MCQDTDAWIHSIHHKTVTRRQPIDADQPHKHPRPGEIYEYNKVTHVGLSLYEHMPSRMPAQVRHRRNMKKSLACFKAAYHSRCRHAIAFLGIIILSIHSDIQATHSTLEIAGVRTLNLLAYCYLQCFLRLK